ncbi:Serine hydroxymethyltransferase [Rickettsiales endosymbiont of Paramecium tredecaurelia]|nr:Serine hydroxymethyltransferase [Candidatus Sarmatiella mevalonica]
MNKSLLLQDSEIASIIDAEYRRQNDAIELIASENYTSLAVMQAQGSILTNKYAEGYSGRRYYCGCQEIDRIEDLAIARVKQLFNCTYANVQPHSGSQANQAVFLALLQPGDCILSMSLDCGGHLTHGASVNLSGKWFKVVHYGLDDNGLIDYNQLRQMALQHKPKLIIAGYSCYSRALDFAVFRQVADEVGAYLMADIAHIAGIVAAGFHQSPIEYAHVTTSTTHKTLRGPRGGLILTNDADIAKKVNSALFPGLQGGPLMHVIAAKAVAFQEALTLEYKQYINQVLINNRAMARVLIVRGHDVLSGGSDNHMTVLSFARVPADSNLNGKVVAEALEEVHIACNKNSVPNDPLPPTITSGIRLGSPACTTRGFGQGEFEEVANIIADVIDCCAGGGVLREKIVALRARSKSLTDAFPIYAPVINYGLN